ncbi:MAG TPA: TatD family hydrolase [Bryobacteraceae bacterium]|nr:TatD family hydrolase [Bryobacteraceae bacterium]
MNLVDSHCHLDDEKFDGDRDAAVERALAAGVERMVVIGTGEGPPDLEAGIRLAEKYDAVYATVGIHPQYAERGDAATLARVAPLLKHPKVIAVGEIGLDYHYDPTPVEQQKRVFITQMALARQASKPIIIHARDAWEDTFSLLAEHWEPSGLPCILHCFTGGPAEAERGLALGCYLSFAGILTYPKSTELQAAAGAAPADRILVETDSPYLAPVPHRGKRNEPAFVVHTARKLAELRGQTLEDIGAATTANFRRVFGIR